jgi:hypothetical protein
MPSFLVTAKIEVTRRVTLPDEAAAIKSVQSELNDQFGPWNNSTIENIEALRVDGGAVVSNPALNQPFEDRFSRT